MSTKQETSIQIGTYYFNGAYRPLLPVASYGVWNVDYNSETEFRSSPTNRSLSGFERGNVSGRRLSVTINLRSTSTDTTNQIRTLLNSCSSQFPRKLADVTLSGLIEADKTIVFDNNKSNVPGFYNGIYIVQGSNRARVDSYATTRTATFVGDNLANGGAELFVYPDKPTIVGVSTDNNPANVIYCNLIDSNLGQIRELTIGTQVITLNLTSVERVKDIPQSIVIQ